MKHAMGPSVPCFARPRAPGLKEEPWGFANPSPGSFVSRNPSDALQTLEIDLAVLAGESDLSSVAALVLLDA